MEFPEIFLAHASDPNLSKVILGQHQMSWLKKGPLVEGPLVVKGNIGDYTKVGYIGYIGVYRV